MIILLHILRIFCIFLFILSALLSSATLPRNCQKIFVAPKPFLSVLTISFGVGSIMNNIYICTYDNFTPHIPYFLYFPVYFGLTFVELDLALLLTCTDWMHSRATSNFDRFALSRLSKCNFADIFIFYILLDIKMQCITLILEFLCCLISSLYIFGWVTR